MKSIGCFILLCFCFDVSVSKHDVSFDKCGKSCRSKRQLPLGIPLVFTNGGTYKFIVGFISPVHAVDYVNFVFAVNFQYQYMELANITEVTQTENGILTISREQRAAELNVRQNERLTFYKAVESLLLSKGFNGPECIRRAICEVAQHPVEEEALVGEILHILLTPSYGINPFEKPDEHYSSSMADYLSAETAGAQMFDCVSIYNSCPEGKGILELISELQDE